MKVFLAKNKFECQASEVDILIVAKTRKEAKVFFDDIKETSGSIYLTKDFQELEVENIKVCGLDIFNCNKHDDAWFTFEIDLHITLKNNIKYYEHRIVETETTYKALINMFKEQNSNLLKRYF